MYRGCWPYPNHVDFVTVMGDAHGLRVVQMFGFINALWEGKCDTLYKPGLKNLHGIGTVLYFLFNHYGD